jgi:catechol 2,3-dioxygenase-like lactoylglutathione lyase family enzyme
MAPEIAKLGHVALVTPNLEQSLWFFRDVIGLDLVERRDDTVYLRAWGDWEHHTLTLRAGDAAVVDHIAWRTKRREDVDLFARQL